MMNKTLKAILIYAGIALLFVVLAYGFTPEVLSGKIVNQSDISAWKGMSNEAVTWNKANPDDPTAWTGSMFGGMPTTAFIDDFNGDWTKPLYKALLLGRRPASYLLVTLLGAFLLMLAMGLDKIIAVAGAIAVAFCSYNMQIIQVGHNTKMQAIAFFPWVLAAIIFTYKSALSDKGTLRSRLPLTVLGSVLFALALSFQIKANHVQITYYLAIVIFVYALGLLISLCIDKEKRPHLKSFFAASALLLSVGCIGIATNANKLIPTYEYTPYTMRGGSELTSDSDSHNQKGLNLDYATAWSYGINEMPNLMIPNFNGGSSSGELPLDSETGKLLKRAGQPHLKETMKALPLYWGPQPFTAGPMYLGAVSIFLFVLGLFLCKGREKWWLLVATIIAVFLAWGNHFMWFTRLWFNYAPMYNKFRTVSMALTVLQVTVPMLGFLVLDRIVKEKYSRKEFNKAGWIAFGLTAGFCLLCVIVPGIAGSFTAASDAGQPEILADALSLDRQTLLRKDALRSLLLITVVFALIQWAYMAKEPFAAKGRMTIISVAIALVVFFDLFSVDKRYLNKSHFVTPRDFNAAYEPRPVDELIHQDEDMSYRVLDISVNTFNDAIQSYHHKCIGGYSPVKMQRYQDLIDHYLNQEIRDLYGVIGKSGTISEVEENLPAMKVTSMLNGRYIILGEDYPPVVNAGAMGNCWFVDDVVPAGNPDEEIALVGEADLRSEAVVGRDFDWVYDAMPSASGASFEGGSEPLEDDVIELISYSPKELIYSYNTDSERLAVFSEVYYPKGWKAWLEPEGSYGEVRHGCYVPTENAVQLDLFRADWILRAAIIPEGRGNVVMRFEPDSYRISENISRASSISLILLLLLSVAGAVLGRLRSGR